MSNGLTVSESDSMKVAVGRAFELMMLWSGTEKRDLPFGSDVLVCGWDVVHLKVANSPVYVLFSLSWHM